MKDHALVLVSLLIVIFIFSIHVYAGECSIQDEPLYVPGEIIIKWKDLSLPLERQAIQIQGSTIPYSVKNDLAERGLPGVCVLTIPDDVDVHDAAAVYAQDPRISYAEPNYLLSCDAQPNDPYFSMQWSMENTGQNGGLQGADIRALRAWDLSTGSARVVVAVIDTGVDIQHQDIRPNRWVNKKEVPKNGIDDDKNGFIDDYFGWDFRDNDNQPDDLHGHGTFCAGIIGAAGNNNIGMTGVNWNVKIMPVKFMGAEGTGSVADAVSAILYAKRNGADILSCSWGGYTYSQSLKDAIDAFPGPVVCSAGNRGSNTDTNPHYPSGYASPHIISVAASNSHDTLWPLSNFGAKTVDLAAPGVDIFSTLPGNSYAFLSGTSAAAPHVSGVAALLLAQYPGMKHSLVKKTILDTADKRHAFSGKVLSKGRLNAYNALTYIILKPAFTSTGTVGEKPFTVDFTDNSQGYIAQRRWDFGDGGVSSEKNPTHIYRKSGSYTVRLTVKNPYVVKKITKEQMIRVVDNLLIISN